MAWYSIFPCQPGESMKSKVSSPALRVTKVLLQFVRFGITGACNATIDILTLNFLLWRFPTHAPGTIIVYNTAAYTLGAVNSYLLNKYWTFQRGKVITGDELLRFIIVNVIGILSNDCIFWVALKILHPSLGNLLFLTNMAKLSAVVGTALISYTGMHLWVFKNASHRRSRHLSIQPGSLPPHPHHSFAATTSQSGQVQGGTPLARGYHLAVRQDERGRKQEKLAMTAMNMQGHESPDHTHQDSESIALMESDTTVRPFLTNYSLSVVLPVHNEEGIIARTVHSMVETLIAWVPDFEVIVVNDGSKDNTQAIVEDIAQSDPHVRLISHSINLGYGAALVTGFEAVTRDLAFFTDSDGQFDPHDLAPFFPLIEEYDAVLGYRVNRQDTWMRKLNAWGWKFLVTTIFGVQVRDVDCAFKLFHAEFFRTNRLETRGAMINAEILYKLKRSGRTYTQLGVRHLPRTSGKATGAKMSVISRALREMIFYAWKWRREE